MTQPPTPGTPSQVVRIGGAKLDIYGDAITTSVPITEDVQNTFRGEGLPLAFQKGRPLIFTTSGGSTIDIAGDDRLARKLLTSQAMRVTKLSTGQLSFTLPTISQFLDAGFKLGHSGSISIGILDASNVGAETYNIITDLNANYFGDLAHITRADPVTHRAACSADWWIDMNSNVGAEDRVAVLWMPKWSGREV